MNLKSKTDTHKKLSKSYLKNSGVTQKDKNILKERIN